MRAEHRQPRIPLFARVETPGCADLGPLYAYNISRGGVYLKAPGASPDDLPLGRGFDVQIALPDGGPRVKLGAEVVWVDPVARQHAGERALGLGVRFHRVDAAAEARLVRLVESFRYTVVSFGFDGADLAQAAVGDLFPVKAVATLDELVDAARTGHVGLVLVNEAPGEAHALEVVDRFLGAGLERRPPVFYCAAASTPRLEAMLGSHQGFQFVQQPIDRVELRSQVHCAVEAFVLAFQNELLSDELARTIDRLWRENAYLRDKVTPPRSVEGMVGQSPAMQKVFELIERVAPLSTTAMILGETGTGKEVVASAIVSRSGRREKPFIVLNCAAFSEALLENELFGHARGAYTGADRDRAGLFEAADGGTLFLDEIGEMPVTMQPRLLRVLEKGEVRRLGETKTRQVDVRIICATHRDLDQRVKEGAFRADLLYRLRSFVISLPPLRERRADVGPLADHFLSLTGARHGRPSRGLDAEAKALLTAHDWPGNARELSHVIERLYVLAGDGPIDAALVREALGQRAAPVTAGAGRTLASLLEDYERELVRAELEKAGGVVAKAARALGVQRTTLTRRLRQLGLRG